jgi:drug/metabolite transporter (DMT)-like permease
MTLVVILSSVIGNFALAWGMHQAKSDALGSALGYIAVLFDPWVAIGVILLIVWLLSQMLLLSWADLSYVLPVTSVAYVLTAISGRLFLHEHISAARWTGVTLIMAGVVLVGRTQHSTTGDGR